MPFNFNTNNTLSLKALKLTSFPLFKYSGFLSQLFFYLFLVSLLLVALSFLGLVSGLIAVKIPLFLFIALIVSLELHLFNDLKIKNLKTDLSLSDVLLSKDSYNIAEFLSIESCRIVREAAQVSKRMGLESIGSGALFYAALMKSKDVQILIFRLGIDIKKVQADLKNYLEKQKKPEKFDLLFSKSFEETIVEAANLTAQRGHQLIGEKEILVALAKRDQFFKKILVEEDLKEKDVENITLWLDSLEDRIKKNKNFGTKENLSKLGSLGRDFASGFTVTLDQFSIDWRKIAKENVFLEIIGHQKEIDQLEIILTKSSLSNALIVGEDGVGKKSIIQALAQRCYLGTGLLELKDKRVVELDMVALLSRIQDQEKLETTLDDIFQEALAAGNVILFIDRLDNFVTQKVQKPGEVDISIILAKYLAMPSFQFVATTSFNGLHRKLEQNPAFLEYFRKIEVSEVSEIETIRILQNLAIALEQKYKTLITYPAIREIVNLTARYLPSIPFPKKAIDILDEAAVYVKSQKETVVLPDHIAKIISDKTQIPMGKMEFKEKSVLINLENLIHQRIVNQQEAVQEISIAMRRARAGISSKKRPMGVFLFLGPTGVGKTETAKALAEIYFGRVARDFSEAKSPDLGENKMIRLDMSEFQSISDIPRLIGAISPVEQQGLLTTPVRENPFSLVLLDEVEKSHPNILNLFLQVFDEGHVTDGQGRKIMFTNTIIICTSNAGAPMIFKTVESGKEIDKRKLLNSLFENGIFKPEFVNRFDAAVIFNPLTKENLMQIAQLMLSNLAKSLKEKEIEFVITEELKAKIVEISYKPEFGAREMRRMVQDKVENEIAKAIISDTIVKGDKIEINPDEFKIIKVS